MEKEKIYIILASLHNSKGKAMRVAESVGKEPTNKGPMAQARIDGYNCALREIEKEIEKSN